MVISRQQLHIYRSFSYCTKNMGYRYITVKTFYFITYYIYSRLVVKMRQPTYKFAGYLSPLLEFLDISRN